MRLGQAFRAAMAIPAAVLIVMVASRASPDAEAAPFPEFGRDPEQARIVTDDLDRFWHAWDLAEADPERREAIFQRQYLEAGTPGLDGFLELRIQDVDRLLGAIDAHPRYYASLRALMPDIRAAAEPVRAAQRRLQELLPEAVFPDTYLMIGALNSGGTIHWEGLLIGVEMYGMTPETPTDELGAWHRAVIGSLDALPAIITHELIHFQQLELTRSARSTLLGYTIHEGAADFVAELIIGAHINDHLHEWALPREAELWAEFREVMHGDDYSDWLYNGGSAVDRPADLGYFIGYRIVQAYYERADDKRAAIREILAMTDPEEFLKRSGYEARLGQSS